MKQYVLALDEGTTSARAILFDREGKIVSLSQHEFPQYYPQSGWVEQDPMELYASQYAAMTECVAKSGVSPEAIAARIVSRSDAEEPDDRSAAVLRLRPVPSQHKHITSAARILSNLVRVRNL